jgi:flagellar biosynthesis/type III secretory pathway ATPase
MSANIVKSSGHDVPGLTSAPTLCGRVVEARGVVARVVGVSLRIGEKVRLVRPDTLEAQYGEVVGFAHDGALVMPLAGLTGLSDITEVQGCGSAWGTFDAAGLLGRVLDGLGNPLDGGPRSTAVPHRSRSRAPPRHRPMPQGRSIRSNGLSSPRRLPPACARSMACSPAASASARVSSHRRAGARARSWA